MVDDSNHGKTRDCRITLSRRNFFEAIGGAAVITAAADPTVADRLRDTPRRSVAGVQESSIDTVSTPTQWNVIGPFQYQRRDVETGWLFPNGSESAYATGERTPDGNQRFQSAFAGGATVTWADETADGDTVSLDFSDRIDPTGGELTPLTGGSGLFDDFQDWYGVGGVLFATGYAFTTFEREQASRAVLETDASVLWLNGQRYEGTPAGVVLQEGTNYLLAKQSLTLASGSVSVSFRPPRAPVEIAPLDAFRGTPQNVILPDLREGERTDRPASVRVTNTTGEPVEEATLTFAPDSDLLVEQTVDIDPPLASFETRRINTQAKTKGRVAPRAGATAQSQRTESVPGLALASTFVGEQAEQLAESEQVGDTDGGSFTVQATSATVTATITVGDATDSRPIPLRIRNADEPRYQTTFTSAYDESVQEFSVREPTNPDSGGPFELIVTLHGANVPSINQAGGLYTQKEDTYILAPGARGPVNYDHEDLGRLDDLEALGVMKERFDIDENSVYLTGHSMGGHGTWHVGLTNPDRFAGLAPSASWTDHETYFTTTYSRDKLYTYPRIKAVKETALQKNLALPKTENAVDGTLPTFVLHGGEDESVPTLLPRTYVRSLANRGLSVKGEVGRRYSTPDPGAVDVAYLEVPGQGHYWEAGIGPGTDTVNHPDLMNFLRSTERNPYPERVRFFTTNLFVENRKFWIAVYEQNTVHAPTIVDARLTEDGIAIETENVAVLSLDLRVLRESSVAAPAQAHINGESVDLPGQDGSTSALVDLRDGVNVSRGQPDDSGRGPRDDPGRGPPDERGRGPPDNPGRGPPRSGLRKTPDQYGPLQEVHYSPYRLVYGTQGDAEETAVNYNLANIRSQRLVDRARAPAIVVPDTAVDESLVQRYNLVLFGRPSSNAILRDLQSELPIQVTSDRASIGGETYRGDLGVEYVYPNPEASDRLVQVETGTSLPGVQLTRVRNWISTQTGTPDYQIYDNTIRFQRWNACLAAGFFDGRWEVSEQLGVLRQTTAVGVGRSSNDETGSEED